ncbi:MAG TPA: hypothetical protein VJ731_06525 [Terriglobales bacterium]|nr:hypothetical protein [Terriglobales bacterium]
MSKATEGVSVSSAAALAAIVLLPLVAAVSADHPVEPQVNTLKVASVSQITHDGLSKTNLLSDGSNLYVTESPAARHVVAKVSLDTAERSVMSTDLVNVEALDISPDHNRLLIAAMHGGGSQNEFWSLPIANGAPERIGSLAGHDGSWSADGQQFVFGNSSSLDLANADGTSQREIFKANGSVIAPRISPDGKHIRFTVSNAALNSTSLWESGIDGSNPHALLRNWPAASNACCGNWTADGRYYIFQATQNRLTTLWALSEPDADGLPVQLTNGPISFGNPSLSHDNNRLWAIGVEPQGEAVSYDQQHKRFMPLLAGISATDLDYSRDGKWVTYVSLPGGELWRCRADGSSQMRLISAPERVALPRWSHDLSQIAFVRMQPGKPWRISVVSVAGGEPQDILPEDQGQIDANWSGDGQRIMFGYVYGSEHLSIKILDLKTHHVETVPGSEGLFSPRWSPNGRYIAALTPDFTKVMLFDFQTKKWTTWLTEPAGAVSYPVWSADSQSLYFDDLVTDEESIRQVKVGESRTERVFKLEGIERFPGPFGLWAGQKPNGEWMFVRDRSTQEVYQLSLSLP